MKKILFVTPTLRNGGGVISGLKNMLSLLPTDKYMIHVLPMGYSDSNNVVLENCRVLDDNFILTSITAIYTECKGYKWRLLLWLVKTVLRLLGMLKLRGSAVNCMFKYASKKYSGYDIVVAYQEGLCTHFVQHIKATRRIAWIHCDYARHLESVGNRSEETIYQKFQNIVCVSKYTLENFLAIYPSLRSQSTFIHNLLDVRRIQESSTEECMDYTFTKDVVTLVSVGRINPVKQFYRIPQIIAEMIKQGVKNFRWLLIGGGHDMAEIERIETEKVKWKVSDSHFNYLGPKTNPFPYIKNSDILVSTSYSEACPFVVNEALALGVPVVSNNYPSIYEFICDGENGRICTLDEMSTVLVNLIKNKSQLDKLKNNVMRRADTNETIINKIENLFA